MTILHKNETIAGSGTQIDLGTTDSLVVGGKGVIQNTDPTDFLSTIWASGSDQFIKVRGMVGAVNNAITMGDDPLSDTNERVMVSHHGRIKDPAGVAISLSANDSSVRNAGKIRADHGIDVFGMNVPSDTPTTASIKNSGKIAASVYGIYVEGDESVTVANTGTIRSKGDAFFSHAADGAQTIDNSGRIVGDIEFGDASDVYDGHDGRLKGHIFGLDGNDRMTGGAAADYFEGDAGRDILTGGGGADHFIFAAAGDSTAEGRDVITDFSHAQHDLIDLSEIDAKASTADTDDAFHLIGTHAFSGEAGELRYSFADKHTLISGDIDGDGIADFQIELRTHAALVEGDFVL